LRAFNDWRKNPRFKVVLNELLRPVYNGADWQKNEGPWSWMFTDEKKTKALLFAINHLKLSKENAFNAKLRWLDPAKTYLIEDITMLSGGKFNHRYCGEFSGAQLKDSGLPINLDAGLERCAAFWIQEKGKDIPQVLYADAPVTSYTEKIAGSGLTVTLKGVPNATAQVVIWKPGKKGVENRGITLDASGQASATFDATTITKDTSLQDAAQAASIKRRRDTSTAGTWPGAFGASAAWLAGRKIEAAGAYVLTTSAPVFVWPNDDGSARVLALAPGTTGPKIAACWTTGDQFTMDVGAPAGKAYRLTVYVMDYDNGKRGMEITVESRDGKVHDAQAATVAEANAGIYLSWDVTGPATIKARKTAGDNAAVSGVFVDETPGNQGKSPK